MVSRGDWDAAFRYTFSPSCTIDLIFPDISLELACALLLCVIVRSYLELRTRIRESSHEAWQNVPQSPVELWLGSMVLLFPSRRSDFPYVSNFHFLFSISEDLSDTTKSSYEGWKCI